MKYKVLSSFCGAVCAAKGETIELKDRAVMHDKQLQDIYECAEPYDIVDKLFGDNVGDVSKAAEEVLDFYGLADEVDKIKNL